MAGFVPFKRIRTGDNSWSHVRSRSDDDLAGRALRKHLIEQVVSGVMSAEQCGILCCKITAAGGVGVSDIAVEPGNGKNSSRKFNATVNAEYRLPSLDYVETPLMLKKSCRRVTRPMPVRYAHRALAEDYVGHVEPTGDDPFVHEKWANHPVRRRAASLGIHWSRILPIQMYFDGVQYSSRDQFHGFFATNLRTGKQYLQFAQRGVAVDLLLL